MARNKGTFKLPANFEVKIQEAIDPRAVVEKKSDLIRKDTWPHDGDTIYVYKYMLVSTDEGVFRLIEPSRVLDEDYSGWERVDGPGGTGGGNIDPELLEGFIPLSRDFSDDFNDDFSR